jgi:general secretion pathway protein A
MYNPYFHFSCSPFENTLDQQFLFLSESHKEAIAALLYFLKEKKSFALVYGDVGTGKTMIVHHLLGRLPRSIKPILIPYPDVEYIEILRYIARVLKIDPQGKEVFDLADEVKAVLREANLDGKQVVLIVDEAHLLSIGSLEHIRLLSNIETTEKKLLQILLIGQNELSHKLHRRDMRQLRQRINVNRLLSPMSPSETTGYIDHRLGVAGSCFDKCFESGCEKTIYKMTRGVPRSVNQLCDTALLICMTEKRDKVTGRILKKAHHALHGDIILAPGQAARSFILEKFSAINLGPVLAGGALVLLLALGLFGYKGNLGENLKGWMNGSDSPREVNTHVEKPPPAVPEVKSEDISKPPGAEENNASNSMPGAVTPQAPGPEQQSPEVLPGEDEMKIETASPSVAEPSVEESGPNPAPPEESPAKDLVPNANGESVQAQAGDKEREIAAGSENPNSDAQNLQTGVKTSESSDAFTITVKKGDTLAGIAEQWFPEDSESGQKWILSANPEINDKNRILTGQILRIPKTKKTGSQSTAEGLQR